MIYLTYFSVGIFAMLIAIQLIQTARNRQLAALNPFSPPPIKEVAAFKASAAISLSIIAACLLIGHAAALARGTGVSDSISLLNWGMVILVILRNYVGYSTGEKHPGPLVGKFLIGAEIFVAICAVLVVCLTLFKAIV